MRILCTCGPRRMRRRDQPAFRCKPSQVSMKYSYFSRETLRVQSLLARSVTIRSCAAFANPENFPTENNPAGDMINYSRVMVSGLISTDELTSYVDTCIRLETREFGAPTSNARPKPRKRKLNRFRINVCVRFFFPLRLKETPRYALLFAVLPAFHARRITFYSKLEPLFAW